MANEQFPIQNPETIKKPENIKEETKDNLKPLNDETANLIGGNTEEEFNEYIESEKAKGTKITTIEDADQPIDPNQKPKSETSSKKIEPSSTTQKGGASFKF